MYVVTTARGDERAGCLVGFASQCSIDPVRFTVWLSKENHTYRLARPGASVLVVHLIDREQHALAERFGGETGDEVDKFAGIEWHAGPEGAPVLDDCPNWFAGRVLDIFDTGDHEAFVLEPIGGDHSRPVDSFTYQQARDIEAGHPPDEDELPSSLREVRTPGIGDGRIREDVDEVGHAGREGAVEGGTEVGGPRHRLARAAERF